jgi:magnesium chelatase family protein
LSGPLLDRIDIHVEVPAVPHKDLLTKAEGEPSSQIRNRVSAARLIQAERFKKSNIYCNAKMSSRHIRTHCRIDEPTTRLLQNAIEKLALSARAYNRVLKIARTIADLAASEAISAEHVAEAIQYRNLDRGKMAV